MWKIELGKIDCWNWLLAQHGLPFYALLLLLVKNTLYMLFLLSLFMLFYNSLICRQGSPKEQNTELAMRIGFDIQLCHILVIWLLEKSFTAWLSLQNENCLPCTPSDYITKEGSEKFCSFLRYSENRLIFRKKQYTHVFMQPTFVEYLL